MSTNSRLQFQPGSERERYSNFVVDLRAKTPAAAAAKEPEKHKSLEKQLQTISSRVASLRLNLLPSRTFSQRLLAAGRRLWQSLVRPRSLFRLRIKRHWRRPQSAWQAFSQEREREFKSVLAAVKKKSRRYHLPFWRPDPAAWYSPLFSFVLVLIVIVAPVKLLADYHGGNLAAWEKNVQQLSQAAIANLLAATEAAFQQDFNAADTNFEEASADFLAAQAELDSISDALLSLARFSPDPKLQLAAQSKKFIAAGVIASSLGRNLVLATDSLFAPDSENIGQRLDVFLKYGDLAVSDARVLEKAIKQIDAANLPQEYQAQFSALAVQASHLAATLDNFVAAGHQLKDILGLTRDKRYLLVFQNNAELRASGGFIGSFALVDVRAGEIKNLEVPAGGSYDLEAGRRVSVAAPEPLWLVDPLWHFWDANWWPDWPTSARNLIWFYQKSGGPSVDGVIGVTPAVVESLLRLTGPIDMQAEYGLTIGADNFWETVAQVVERDNLALSHPEVAASLPAATSSPFTSTVPFSQGLESNSAHKPKKIIGDLMVRILEVLPSRLNRASLPAAVAVVEESLAAKHVLFYFSDQKQQAEVLKRNWGGAVRETQADYLQVVNTNIAGQKSDRLMREAINHRSVVAADGSILNTVTITRTHTGRPHEPLTGVRNVDWLRVYVPAGSELISAVGFRRPDPSYFQEQPEADWLSSPELAAENAARIEPGSLTKIYEENGKTVFANWLMVDPGETSSVVITYRLPFSFFELSSHLSGFDRLTAWLSTDSRPLVPYSLLVQKQPGALASEFTSSLQLPPAAEAVWWPEAINGRSSGWQISASLTGDRYFPMLVKKNK